MKRPPNSLRAGADMTDVHALDVARIVEQAGDAFIFADREGTIRIWNAAATRVFGFTAEEVIGRAMDMIIPEKLRDAHWKGFDHAMQTGQLRLAGKPTLTRGAHKSGDRLYVEMTFALVRDASGAPVGSVAIARDVTERELRARAKPPQDGSKASAD
jgi:PAS domain S-box-containing protein